MLTASQTTSTTFPAPPVGPAQIVSPSTRMIAGYTKGADVRRQHTIVSLYSWQTFGQPLGAYYQDAPGMRDLMEDAEAGEIAVIIVESLDRIARSFRSIERFASLCRRMEIQVRIPGTDEYLSAGLLTQTVEPTPTRMAAAKAGREATAKGFAA